MIHRGTNIRSWVAGGLLLGAVALSVAVLMPLDFQTANSLPRMTASRGSIPLSSRVPPLEAYATLWELDLQRPLIDSPVIVEPAVADPSSASTLPGLRLIGTAIEPGHSVAFFETESGAIEIKRIGNRINGVELSAIDTDHVQVSWRGQSVALKVVAASVPRPSATTALPTLKVLPDPGPDGVIHLFTSSTADSKPLDQPVPSK